MEIFDSIGPRLLEVREQMGKTQSDFAAIAAKAGVPGATRQSQAKYEKGIAMPSAAYLAAIAAAGADVLYILTGIPADAQRRLAVLDRGMEIASKESDSFEDIKRVGVALSNQMNAQQQPALSQRQRALLDNYEHANESGKKIIEGTASLAAQSDKRKKA